MSSTVIPWRSSTRAVPAVATSEKPISLRRLASVVTGRLSRFFTEMKTVPEVGSTSPAATCDVDELARLDPRVRRQRMAEQGRGGDLRERQPDGLGDERHRARGARVDL